MFVYQVVGLSGGVRKYDSVEELVANHKQVGVVEGSWLREELQGQPELEGLLGGMYDGVNKDGKHVIRYETQDAYDMYSR